MKKQCKQTEEQQSVNTRRKQLEKRQRELFAHCTLDEYQRLAAEYSDIAYALECEIEIDKRGWRANARGSERRVPKAQRPFTLNK